MNEPLVSIIIVNWNGRKYLNECLGSLSKITYKKNEIFFVDNNSSDGSVDFVKKNFLKIKIIRNEKNLGYAQGHEVALKHARGEAILLLNTDTIVEKNLVDELIKALYKNVNIAAVQPKVVMYPQTDKIDSIGSFSTNSGLLYHYGREKNPQLAQYNKEMEIYSAKGVCVLFKKNVIEKTGLFDKDYFAYFEETDLCHRIWLAGYSIIYTPKSTVYHKGGGASKQMHTDYILFHAYKNRVCTYIKNLSTFYLIRVLPQTLILYFITCVIYLCMLRINYVLSVIHACVWNIKNIKTTLRKRKYIQENIRVVPDDYFLPRLTKTVSISYYYYIAFGGLDKYKD